MRRLENGNPEGYKPFQSKNENQPTYDGKSGNRTRATLVGGEGSQHYAIPAPQYSFQMNGKRERPLNYAYLLILLCRSASTF